MEIIKAPFAVATFGKKPIDGQKERGAHAASARGPLPGPGWRREARDPSALLRVCVLWEQMASGTLKLSFVYYINPYKKISFNEE